MGSDILGMRDQRIAWERRQLEKQIAILHNALAFYADSRTWDTDLNPVPLSQEDAGLRARKALDQKTKLANMYWSP